MKKGNYTFPKTSTGAEELNEIKGGEFPEGRPTLSCGGAGCGKTGLAIQFLIKGITEYNEPGVFMSFEESAKDLSQNVKSLDFDLEELIAQKKLKVDFIESAKEGNESIQCITACGAKDALRVKYFDICKVPGAEHFGLVIEGYLKIEKEGYYTFVTDPDDLVKMYLGMQLLFNYDGIHAERRPQSNMVPLEKGFYPLRIEFFQDTGGRLLRLLYWPKEGGFQAVPIRLQYNRK